MKNKNWANKVLVSVLVAAFGSAAGALGDEKPLRARATLSYHGTAGNTNTHGLATCGDAEYTYRKFVFDGSGDYTFAASGGKKTAENIGFFAGTKFFFTGGDRLYARYKGWWRRNTFAGFDHRLSNFGGPAVYLVRSETQELAVGSLLGYVHEHFTEAAGKHSVGFPAACVGGDYRSKFNDVYELDASLTWNVSLEDTRDRLLAANACFGLVLADWLVMTVTEKVEWDTITPEGYATHDATTTVGLTVRNS
jgi:putative salt-induced outer membrane protein YdiY